MGGSRLGGSAGDDGAVGPAHLVALGHPGHPGLVLLGAEHLELADELLALGELPPGQGLGAAPGPPSASVLKVSLRMGVDTRNASRGGTSNSWTTEPIGPVAGSRTTILAWWSPGTELEVPDDREPDPVQPLAGGGPQPHVDRLVVAEELAALAVGDDEEELDLGDLSGPPPPSNSRPRMSTSATTRTLGLAEHLLGAHVVGHAEGDPVLGPGRVEGRLDDGVDPLLAAGGGWSRPPSGA